MTGLARRWLRVGIAVLVVAAQWLPAAPAADAAQPTPARDEPVLHNPISQPVQVVAGGSADVRVVFHHTKQGLTDFDVRVFARGVSATVRDVSPWGIPNGWSSAIQLHITAPASLARARVTRYFVTLQVREILGTGRFVIPVKVDVINPNVGPAANPTAARSPTRAPATATRPPPTPTRRAAASTPTPTRPTPSPTAPSRSATSTPAAHGMLLHAATVTVGSTTYLTLNAAPPAETPASLSASLAAGRAARLADDAADLSLFAADPVPDDQKWDLGGRWTFVAFLRTSATIGDARVRAWIYRVGRSGFATSVATSNPAPGSVVLPGRIARTWAVDVPRGTLLGPGERWAVTFEIVSSSARDGVEWLDFDTSVEPARVSPSITILAASRTATPTSTPSATPTSPPTGTPTPTATATSTTTATSTATATSTTTATLTATRTSTATSTATNTPSRTPTATATWTPTRTATSTAAPTDTPVPTDTPPPTATPPSTSTPTDTPIPTPTASRTPTETAIPSATAHSSPTPADSGGGGKVNGGGWLLVDGARVRFELEVSRDEAGQVRGHFRYVGAGIAVESAQIAYARISTDSATFGGSCERNDSACTFEATALDGGHSDGDTLRLTLDGQQFGTAHVVDGEVNVHGGGGDGGSADDHETPRTEGAD